MAGGSGKQEKAEESRLKAEAVAAAKKAAEVDPFEQEQPKRVQARADWESGAAGPRDVRKMPGSGVGMSLFAEAKKARDAGRVGRGFASPESGANPAFSAALAKEATWSGTSPPRPGSMTTSRAGSPASTSGCWGWPARPRSGPSASRAWLTVVTQPTSTGPIVPLFSNDWLWDGLVLRDLLR